MLSTCSTCIILIELVFLLYMYCPLQEDIDAWYPKLKVGGLFAGHDFVTDGLHANGKALRRCTVTGCDNTAAYPSHLLQ